MSDPVAEVKARWTMPMLIEHLTGEPVPGNNKIHSLWNPADETPSMHVYEDHFWDYSTGKGGDVIALVQLLKRCSFHSALEILSEEADDLKLDAVERVKAEKPEFKVPDMLWFLDPIEPWKEPLDGVSVTCWHSLFAGRWVTVKGDMDLAIPHYHGMEITGIKYRSPYGSKTSEPGSVFTKRLYNILPAARSETSVAVIVEGESDCWALQGRQPDVDVYALPAGASTIRAEWFERFMDFYEKVYVCMDNDRAGNEARDKILRMSHWQFDRLDVPSMYNDVREAIAAGWKPAI